MSLFLKRFKLQLTEGNRIQKYFLYAIGEIIVVVIGILIAMAVTNVNDQRRKVNDFNARIQIVESEILKDMTSYEELFANAEYTDSLRTLVLHNKVTREMYSNLSTYLECYKWLIVSGNHDSFMQTIEIPYFITQHYNDFVDNNRELQTSVLSRIDTSFGGLILVRRIIFLINLMHGLNL